MRKLFIITIMTLFLITSIILSNTVCSVQNLPISKIENTGAEQNSNYKKLTIGNYDLPDLTIELNITSEQTYWRVRAKINNQGKATIPAGTNIVWKIEENLKPLYWIKVIPFTPFEPNTSINGLPESQELKFKKLRWRGHEITAIVDPPYEEDYPWIELNPDPVSGLIIESNENNNYDDFIFPKAFSFQSIMIFKYIKNK